MTTVIRGDDNFDSASPIGANAYTVKAWVNFNGQGTVTILGNGNISSITDNARGIYTLTFSNGMADANYSSAQAATADINDAHVHGYLSNGGGSIGTYTSTQLQVSYIHDENSSDRADPFKACWTMTR
jgi:hypothetical protein